MIWLFQGGLPAADVPWFKKLFKLKQKTEFYLSAPLKNAKDFNSFLSQRIVDSSPGVSK